MMDFQYDAMIDEMNERTFRHCIELLWPLLNFRYLGHEDVRRMDLKEWVASLTARLTPAPGNAQHGQGTVDRYVQAIRFFFNNGYLPVEKGSMAEAYSERARLIMNDYARRNKPEKDMEELFSHFICLTRAAWPSYLKGRIPPIREINSHVTLEDGVLLWQMRTHRFEKASLPFVHSVTGSDHQDYGQRDFAYLYHILLFCGLMQKQGAFSDSSTK